MIDDGDCGAVGGMKNGRGNRTYIFLMKGIGLWKRMYKY
jgi:hypothetical protein